MKDFWSRFATNEFRWIARIFGTLLGLFLLLEIIESLGYLAEADTQFYVIRVGFILVFAGCVVGWFKEFAASLLILGGTAILFAMSVRAMSIRAPGVRPQGLFLLIVPALLGFLYLAIHLGTKKK